MLKLQLTITFGTVIQIQILGILFIFLI